MLVRLAPVRKRLRLGLLLILQLVVVGLTAVTLCALVMLPLAWATVWKLGGLIPEADSTEQLAQD